MLMMAVSDWLGIKLFWYNCHFWDEVVICISAQWGVEVEVDASSDCCGISLLWKLDWAILIPWMIYNDDGDVGDDVLDNLELYQVGLD